MKRLVPVTAIVMSIGLFSSANADMYQEMQMLVTGYEAVIPFCPDIQAQGALAHQTEGDLGDQDVIKSYEPEITQAGSIPPDRLVQAMGETCITPTDRCRLKKPAPINSSCCCPNGKCGHVGP